MPKQRPNILWLMTDEQRTDSLGCYGSPWARTPHLDSLAARGTLFEAAVTPAPVCVPARVSLLSGKRPRETNILSNNDREGNWEPLTHIFRDHGYQTATFGKQHYFREDVFETTVSKVLSDSVHCFHYEKGYAEVEFAVVKYPSEHRGWIFAGRFPEGAENTAEAQVNEAAVQWLEQRDPARPFLLRISYNGPHTPVVAPDPFDSMIEPDSIDLPQCFLPPAEGKPRWETEFLREFQGSHRLTHEQLRRAHQCYYGLVTFLDAQFGQLLEWMGARGLLDDTIIAFTSDHGTHLGDHTMMQKQSFYDPVVNVPLVICAPGDVPRGARVRTPVETLSLLPTLLDLAELPVPEELDQISLGGTVRNGEEPAPRAVFSEFTQATWDYRPEDRLVMVRRGPWKLVLFWGGPDTDPFSEWADGSLYNLERDPMERENVIGAGKNREVVRSLVEEVER